MLHVIQVVTEFLERVIERGTVAVFHLRPAGESRLDGVTLFVERNLLGKLIDEERAFGARPDETHVSTKHVPQLWKLVETRQPDEAADQRHPVVLGASP